MDHTRDNPLKRFTAFWIAILLVFCFGMGLILLRPFTHRDGETAYDVISKQRLEVKGDLDRGQEEALNSGAIEKALTARLTSYRQDTVQKSAMPVPGGAPAPTEKPEDGKSPEDEASPAATN